jgi:hypothetical protein
MIITSNPPTSFLPKINRAGEYAGGRKIGLERVKSRVLRKMFGPKCDKVGGRCRKLYNEQLHNLYSSPNIVRVIKSIEIGGACRTCGGQHRCILGFRCLTKKPEDKRPLGRPGCRWEDNIKIDQSRIGIGSLTSLISFGIGTGRALL